MFFKGFLVRNLLRSLTHDLPISWLDYFEFYCVTGTIKKVIDLSKYNLSFFLFTFSFRHQPMAAN
jgi:hypothetical protein